MKEFTQLLEIATILNSPDGCPWDRIQTFATLRTFLLEEAHEVLEAVDASDQEGMIEELGDLFYVIIFFTKIAEKEGLFTLAQVMERLRMKLIRRHPHVFGDKRAETIDDVKHNWEKAKKEEKKDRKGPFDGIPKTLPALQKAQKILEKIDKKPVSLKIKSQSEELAEQILEIVQRANEEKIDIESALRQYLHTHLINY